MKRKNGRGSKDKGKAFEREIVASILEAFPQLSEHDILARSMGDPGLDIILSKAARVIMPLAIEAKRVNRLENLNIKKAMAQAKANCPPELVPVVVYREDRHEAMVSLQIIGLMRLLGINVSDESRPEILVALGWADLLSLLGGK